MKLRSAFAVTVLLGVCATARADLPCKEHKLEIERNGAAMQTKFIATNVLNTNDVKTFVVNERLMPSLSAYTVCKGAKLEYALIGRNNSIVTSNGNRILSLNPYTANKLVNYDGMLNFYLAEGLQVHSSAAAILFKQLGFESFESAEGGQLVNPYRQDATVGYGSLNGNIYLLSSDGTVYSYP